MNKLRKKIFWILFSILSLFLISILWIFNYQNYNNEKENVKRNLLRINNEEGIVGPKNKGEDIFPKNNTYPDLLEEGNVKKFMDATIYTIFLDQNNEILDIISHTEDGLVEENVEKIALEIIYENKQSRSYIGNLYFSHYSYHYVANHYITLCDNTEISQKLISYLKITILLFLLAEVMVVLLSQMLSQWIIKPVEITFNKQKQFVADASHELKTPLSVIMACAEALENNKEESKWLMNIQEEAERMNKLITNLLDLAKLENENDTKCYEEVNVSKLVEMSILSLESLLYEKNIQLDYKIEPHIQYKCNSEQMKQLVSILMDNAIKHSCSKGTIIASLRKEKNSIVLEIKNKGDPIPKGEEEKIFDRFYRIDKSRNRKENRYGLGLAIAKSIVFNHHGNIYASSNHGYTTFTVILK